MIFHSYVGLYQSGHKYTNIFMGHWLRREIPRSNQWRQSERTYVGGWVCDIISVISDEHISFRVFVVSLSILCVFIRVIVILGDYQQGDSSRVDMFYTPISPKKHDIRQDPWHFP